jgi:hypothetical protein
MGAAGGTGGGGRDRCCHDDEGTEMRIDMDLLAREIGNLRTSYPDLTEEDFDLALSSETELDEALTELVNRIGHDKELSTGAGERIKEIQARKSRIDHRIDATRDLIRRLMVMANVPKRELPEATLTVRVGQPGFEVVSSDQVPASFQRVTVTPDRTAIRDAIKAGQMVPGVRETAPETVLTVRTK